MLFYIWPYRANQIIGIAMGSHPAPFFANEFLYFHESTWMKELKKNHLIKARKICNIFRFIDDLNAISDGVEFESIYCYIYPEELGLGKKNTKRHEASFLGLDIKIRDEKFQVSLYVKRDSFPFSVVRMPDKSSCIQSSIVFSAIGAESFRITRASNNPDSFFTAIKPLISLISRQGVSNRKIKRVILKFFKETSMRF